MTGIEMALWDIKGKALVSRCWNLLGGRFRDRIPRLWPRQDARARRPAAGARLQGAEGGRRHLQGC